MAALAESLRAPTRLETAIRTVTVALLLSVWCGTPPLFAAGLRGGKLLAAALAETTRLATAPTTGTHYKGGAAMLGTGLGADVGALVGVASRR